jgi:DNA-binding phage protein
MSSPDFEAFLIRVLLDADKRQQFLAAPQSVARAAGLTEQEVAALASIDRPGLLMAAESLRRKRAATGRVTGTARGRWRRWRPWRHQPF